MKNSWNQSFICFTSATSCLTVNKHPAVNRLHMVNLFDTVCLFSVLCMLSASSYETAPVAVIQEPNITTTVPCPCRYTKCLLASIKNKINFLKPIKRTIFSHRYLEPNTWDLLSASHIYQFAAVWNSCYKPHNTVIMYNMYFITIHYDILWTTY